MIEKMHDRTNGPVFKIIFALVSLSFVLGGIGGGMMLNDTSAVKVNGEEISQQAFLQAKNREQNLRNAQEGDKFWEKLEDPKYVEQFQAYIFDGLVDEALMRQYVQELKLGISDSQVKSHIVNMPAFQQDGKFENALYQQTLRNNGITADHYATIVKDGMLMSQLQEGIINSEFSVPAQQAVLAKLLLQNRQIRVAQFPILAELSKVSVEETEAQAFFEQHKANFVNPEKLTVEYLTVSPKDIEKNVEVGDAQIETYYQTNKAKYVTSGESQLAHIQVADEAAATAIVQAVKNGEDFAKLAQEKSQDLGSAKAGGDLGWAKAGTFPKAFEDAANALSVGEISQPIKIDNAYHVVKVLDRKASKEIPLAEVKAQIAKTIRDELVMSEYSNLIREMAKSALENSSSLAEIAKLANLPIQTTAAFTEQTVPAELNNEKVIQTLFKGDLRKNGQVSEGIELTEHGQPQTMFVRVSQYDPQSVQDFAQAKAAVIEAVKLEKAGKLLNEQGETLLKALNEGNSDAVKFGNSRELMFAQAQLQEPLLAKTVFAMPKPDGKPSYQSLRDANGDLLIIALDKITDGNLETFNQGAAQQFAEADKALLLQNVVRDLRERAKVEINQDFAEQQLESNSQ